MYIYIYDILFIHIHTCIYIFVIMVLNIAVHYIIFITSYHIIVYSVVLCNIISYYIVVLYCIVFSMVHLSELQVHIVVVRNLKKGTYLVDVFKYMTPRKERTCSMKFIFVSCSMLFHVLFCGSIISPYFPTMVGKHPHYGYHRPYIGWFRGRWFCITISLS